MPHLDGTGPESNGMIDGRKLGKCTQLHNDTTKQYALGQGMGKRRKAGKNEILKH